MDKFLPITLSGQNLGERQRYLNSLVNRAVVDLKSFQDIANEPELSPVDRLFKIDLAIKLNNVDYIVKTLKDDDMLYVSRALKCKWLLEIRDIINPKYLEDVLFPEMVMPAITKMKHWLYINLHDPLICQEFYQYHKDAKFDFAVKFLTHCDNNFLISEFPKILTKITPHNLKVFGEKCPEVVKIFFDSLATDNDLVKRYLMEEQKFYKSIKSILRLNPDIFFDITEKYLNLRSCNKLSPSATDYVLRFHKNRFLAKPAFYVIYVLHAPTVVRRLSSEECQDMVIMFARAEYLKQWFNYPNMEFLIKRVSESERGAFKKRVFVDKDVGERVAEWPYALPTSPVANDDSSQNPPVFHDKDYSPIQLGGFQLTDRMNAYLMSLECRGDMIECCGFLRTESELQKLFKEFRYVGFEGTFHALRPRISTAKSADSRRDMLLVLVSKSGGRENAVRTLLQFILRHRNEAVHERAAIVRSLVKRAKAWRFPQDVWDMMLDYAHGLGLDGSKPEASCCEGLHAVVMRQLIATGDSGPAILTAFFKAFTTFTDYKLVESERIKIAAGLQRILVTIAADVESEEAANHLTRLLNVLKDYHMRIESSVITAVAGLAERNSKAAISLLKRLYNARVGRRELLAQNLEFKHDDAALLNVLRHDPAVLKLGWVLQLLEERETRANHFFSKITIYFNERGGLAEHIKNMLQKKITDKPDVVLARPLAMFAGGDIISLWREQDKAGAEHHKLAAALRANMHRARPAPDALALGWRQAGMKAVACRATRCRPALVPNLIQTLLTEREKRTVRLALSLAFRTSCAVDIFSAAVLIRPLAALRAALLYYRKFGDAADLRIWDIVKPTFFSANLVSGEGLRHILKKVKCVPHAIKPDFCAISYLTLSKISNFNTDYVLCELINVLPEVTDDLLEDVMLQMLLCIEKENPESYPAIIVRYLMLSRSSTELKTRLERTGDLFLAMLYSFRDTDGSSSRHYFFERNLTQLISSLQYNFAFFNKEYQCCVPVIDWALKWMQTFLPTKEYFKHYFPIYTTILYYKAVRYNMEQNREIFADPAKKMTEGVNIVGFTFGRYIANGLAEMTKYFESIIEIYKDGFRDCLDEYVVFHRGGATPFITAMVKGIIAGSVGNEARLAIQAMQFHEAAWSDEIENLVMKTEDKETQFFLYADLFT